LESSSNLVFVLETRFLIMHLPLLFA